MTLQAFELDDLKNRASLACKNAHAPYSRFTVGAAVIDRNAQVFAGCNVENASYGLTMCAERNAIAAAVAAGVVAGDLQLILIYTPGNRPAPPCGGCRQVIHEMMPAEATVVSCCDSAEQMKWSVAQVLPDPFRMEEM